MSYLTIESPATAEITIKRSQFIASLFPVKTEDEAKEIIAAVKKKYYDARHNPYAYILIDGRQKSSDDGEPSGTSGKSILNAIAKNELAGVIAVVTRYFGGIKLGTNGLVRAYSDAAVAAINNAAIIEIKTMARLELQFDYGQLKSLENHLAKNGRKFSNISYTENVTAEILIEPENENSLIESLTDFCNGKIKIAENGVEEIAVPKKLC